MSDTTQAGASRRNFLKLAGTAAPAAAAAVALGGHEAEAAEPAGPHKGLADTAHTRAYFDTARF
ncbi:twin-arginine translocation pathway signal protein [Roseivivax halodurans JCM 10272]|uniref:Twin-arginine translocation pathway signal protein n=1 Tax=Roseivivax halodurans JCM 10272 TaxID=1449350 RepID=X7EM18_9RHOB|nr:twin-arginine translocation signal domain-containing protein [Roseivivax halodurans]ETX16226.1 twin-arginine translocation pathway signal protein [Roseivivax halodurans JCM 10272]